jgi:hypothetical protein
MNKKLPLSHLLKICVLCLGIVVAGCNEKTNKPAVSFCFWKTTFLLDNKEDSIMTKLGVNHFYLRFFDVDWNPYEKEALPVATIHYFSGNEIMKVSVTPCIFITNTVMEKSSKIQLDTLALRIQIRTSQLISQLKESFANHYYDSVYNKAYNRYKCHPLHFNNDSVRQVAEKIFARKVQDILIDCDWTLGTRDNYFYFLKQLKHNFSGYKLSTTLRLWQYQQQKSAGVPDVDRCLLMCYSMESPSSYTIENSISSVKELQKYLTKKHYPLKLDIALPIFSWAVTFHEGNFKGLVNGIDPTTYKEDTASYFALSDNRYKLKKDIMIVNKYFRYGDELRPEQVSPDELAKMAKILKKSVDLDKDARVTFFSWDTVYIKHYGIENIKNCCRLLHR